MKVVRFPDNVDLDIPRRSFFKRQAMLRTPMIVWLLTTVKLRDTYHPWISRKVRNIVGTKYLLTPAAEDQSFVLILPSSQAASAVTSLLDLGFVVENSVKVQCGDAAEIQRITRWCHAFNFVVIAYIWMLLIVLIVNETQRIKRSFDAFVVQKQRERAEEKHQHT